jgi:hypothetical protein
MNWGALVRPQTAAQWRRLIVLMLLADVAWLAAIWLWGRV